MVTKKSLYPAMLFLGLQMVPVLAIAQTPPGIRIHNASYNVVVPEGTGGASPAWSLVGGTTNKFSVTYINGSENMDWEATVEHLGDGHWKLTVENNSSAAEIVEVAFPFEDSNKNLSTDSNSTDRADNFAFTPAYYGYFRKTRNNVVPAPDFYDLQPYPGFYFSPFLIVADDGASRICHAANNPPREVYPNIRNNGIQLYYRGLEIGNTESDEFYLVWKEFTGNATNGDHPWYKAAVAYREWLQGIMTTQGLYPVAYNDWMVENHGILNIQLENLNPVSAAYGYWEDTRDDLSWVQFWGQMSDTACCARIQSLHSDYTNANAFGTGITITDFAEDIAGYNDGHIGYYSRGADPYSETYTNATNIEWWVDWLELQKNSWNANAAYLDILGTTYHGSAYAIAGLFENAWQAPPSTYELGFAFDTTDSGTDVLIEGFVDVYPAAFLTGGAFGTDTSSIHSGGPGFTLEDAKSTMSTAGMYFPRLATVIGNDRFFYTGESNGGVHMWGNANYRNPSDESFNYWMERNAFLLGHKLDVIHYQLSDYTTENPRFRDIIDLRNEHNWWKREIRYQDNDGLTDVDSSLRVRRFLDENGENVFAVEWWAFDPMSIPSPLPTFEYNSVEYDAPVSIFGVVETAFNYSSSSPCDSNNNGLPDYTEKMACIYDLNGSGDVDSCDVDVVDHFSGNCSPSSGYVSIFDFDCDGCVDGDDKAFIAARLSETCN